MAAVPLWQESKILTSRAVLALTALSHSRS
jgi:hypothetical protein